MQRQFIRPFFTSKTSFAQGFRPSLPFTVSIISAAALLFNTVSAFTGPSRQFSTTTASPLDAKMASPSSSTGFFSCISHLLAHNPAQLNYGISISDVDNDGQFEIIVAGYGAPNLMLKWDSESKSFRDISTPPIQDSDRKAIGVAAGDVDGDGREEIYVLNTDSFGGRKQFSDRLFKFDSESKEWIDLFSLKENEGAVNLVAGRSVAAVDRLGTGQYGFFVANYGGPMRLYESIAKNTLRDAGPSVGLGHLITGGRGVLSLPLMHPESGKMDIICANERGPNFVLANKGDGTFTDVAEEVGMEDEGEHGRGIAVVNNPMNPGQLDVVYGNWEGPHRLFVRQTDKNSKSGLPVFEDEAPASMARSSRIRTVIAADFDNDGYEEILFNNIGQPNRLFGWREGEWKQLPIGDALEPSGLGTGAAIGDFDNDGVLELIVSHGEMGAQPLSLFKLGSPNKNNWLRLLPLTQNGAPARGAIVKIEDADGRVQVRAIDAGSGYLCQMEPVAHFGLGEKTGTVKVEVIWPGGERKKLEGLDLNQLVRIKHPSND